MMGRAIAAAPLSAFPLIATRNVTELEEAVARYFGAIRFSLPKRNSPFEVITNHCQLPTVGLTYASHEGPLQVELPAFGFYGQLIAFGGQATATAGRAEVGVVRGQTFVGNVEDTIRMDYVPGFQQIVIKFDPAVMVRKLESLAGDRIVGNLRFESTSSIDRPEAEHFKKMIWFLIDRLDSGVPGFHPLALSEFEQALMVLFMTTNPHNQSHLLGLRPPPVAPWQVRRVEEYIEANWDQPITVEALAVVTGTSARSIFYSFRKSRGYSPMEFVKHLRLQRARSMLADPNSNESVTSVAFACGFGNLGHFANYYQQKFGERPSETLRRARGAPEKNG